MHRHKRLFERIAALKNVIGAAKAALRGKRLRRPGAEFLADFEKEVVALHEELNEGTYRHGGYHYFKIHEPKERQVAAAPFRDRVVHHAIVRVKGYVRYMDDFLLFGDDRRKLKQQGRAVQEKLAELRLTMHPDKYRLLHTVAGVDFTGYVVFANGRVRVRSSSVRRFDRRYRRLLCEVKTRQRRPEEVTVSVRAWVAHAKHAQSVGLRRSVLCRRTKRGWPGPNGSFRGLRGGSFNNNNDNLHAANRNNNNPTNENNNVGFRVASP